MSRNDQHSETEYDSLKDVLEFQKNMYNPGHYIGTGRVPPIVSAPGNAMPLVVACFVASALALAFGVLLLFSDVNVVSFGLARSAMANKIITIIIILVISLFLMILGFGYLKKAKRYYRQKAAMKSEQTDNMIADKIAHRTCPKCGISHDFDYPKCPGCKFDYYE